MIATYKLKNSFHLEKF